jgi:hypothetical protein
MAGERGRAAVAARLRWMADRVEAGEADQVEFDAQRITYGDGEGAWIAEVRFTGPPPPETALPGWTVDSETTLTSGPQRAQS